MFRASMTSPQSGPRSGRARSGSRSLTDELSHRRPGGRTLGSSPGTSPSRRCSRRASTRPARTEHEPVDIATTYEHASLTGPGHARGGRTRCSRTSCDMYGDTWTRGMVLEALIRHEAHHRGQMTVLMRQAGLVVPGCYGPAREEWAQWGMEAHRSEVARMRYRGSQSSRPSQPRHPRVPATAARRTRATRRRPTHGRTP
jgi:hypothetical protein